MRLRNVVPVVFTVLVMGRSGSGGELKIEPFQQYLLLSATKTSTMEEELGMAASQGFRIMQAASSGVGVLLLLERAAKPPETYQYKILATVKIDTMEKELTDLAKEGYRLLPRTIMTKRKMIGPPELLCVLEREPGASEQQRWEYEVLGTSRTSTLEKEILESRQKDFAVVGLTTANERTVIMERAMKGTAAPKP